MNSVVLIIPASIKPAALKIAWALGFQDQAGDSFPMAASADGSEPATHWFSRGQANPGQTALLQGVKAGQIPAAPASGGAWSDYGLALSDLQAMAAALVVDLREYDAEFDFGGHIAEALAENGLMPVVTATTM